MSKLEIAMPKLQNSESYRKTKEKLIQVICVATLIVFSLGAVSTSAAERRAMQEQQCTVSDRFDLQDYINGNPSVNKKQIPKGFTIIKKNVKVRTTDNVGQYGLPVDGIKPGSYLRWNSHDIADCMVRDDRGKVWFVQKSKDGFPFYMPQDEGMKEEIGTQ